MAALHSFLFKLASSSSSNLPFPKQHKKTQSQMLSLCLFVFFTTFSLLVLSFSIHRRLNNRKKRLRETEQETLKPTRLTHDPSCPDPARETGRVDGNGSAHQLPRSARSLLLEILPSDSPKWERLFGAENEAGPDASEPGRVDPGVDQRAGKRKKKRARKKSSNSKGEEEDNSGNNNGEEGFVRSREKPDLVCLYPFTSSSSVTQRKIKQQYDELMKCHHSRRLTLAQVGQFANCLVEAKNELQHKADVIQRKFTITKALLVKADRSSFDRLRQQIYKLELEQKRLEEDAFVYNWLQQQLKLSPAYKRMLEIGARMELKAKSGELLESRDPEYSDISFEELLAQEKKDSFWQRNGKLRPCSR